MIRNLIVDMLLEIINVPDERFQRLMKAINDSDLSLPMKRDLEDILKSACNQTKQAKEMGWM